MPMSEAPIDLGVRHGLDAVFGHQHGEDPGDEADGRDHRQALRPAQRIDEADQPSGLGLRCTGRKPSAIGVRTCPSGSVRPRRFRFLVVDARCGRGVSDDLATADRNRLRRRRDRSAAPAPPGSPATAGTSSRPPQAGHRPTRPGFAPGALIRIPHPHTRIGTSIESPAPQPLVRFGPGHGRPLSPSRPTTSVMGCLVTGSMRQVREHQVVVGG